MAQNKRVLVITGPTATGKTALGVALAEALDGEVISADSMQVYRGMDIGTAKVTAAETKGVPHHLIDVADPAEAYSVSRWVEAAAEAGENILARGRVPILVGGTNLYIDSLLSGRDFASMDDGQTRSALSREYDTLGGEAFLEKLRQVDPARAAVLHPADKKRLVRAMEVFLLTGEPISVHDQRSQALPPRWDSLRVVLSYRDRSALYARIDARVDQMVEMGLFQEVEALLNAGLARSSTAMQAIGYKEVAEALSGAVSQAEAIEAIKQSSRRYAKRQLTWLRRDAGAVWIYRDEVPDLDAAVETVLRYWREI